MNQPPKSLWQRAGALADATPDNRNRYVDFLRAASIAAVIFGHWLVSAPYMLDGDVVPGHMLALAPWTRWLTLVVQVMPIFFLVGGYANAVAWEAAERRGTPYGEWLGSRLRRLIAPVLPVLIAWIGISVAAVTAGAPAEWVGMVTQLALVPTWFLAVYVMVGVLVPTTHRLWARYGFASFAGFALAAVLVDFIHVGLGATGLGYLNYAFVWLAVHQLGYAWRAGDMRSPLAWAAVGGSALWLLVVHGPYPLAMVGVPGQELGNTSPPTLALLALGITQTGLVLALEALAKRLLAHRRAWTATVLVNGMIMTLFLWHMTAMVLALGVSITLGGVGLDLMPNTLAWWAARPLWMTAFALTLAPMVAYAARFERPAGGQTLVSARRLVTGASLVCAGLGLLSAGGIINAAGNLRVIPAALPLLGTGLAGFGPFAGFLGAKQR
jgi:hypothetical protein